MSIREIAKKHKKERPVPEGWTLIGEVNGKPRYRTTPAVSEKVEVQTEPTKKKELRVVFIGDIVRRVGHACDSCGGRGRKLLGDGTLDKCFPCDGKGKFNEADIAFDQMRLQTGKPRSQYRYEWV